MPLPIYSVVKYSEVYKDAWNAFVANAKNATFLFNRNFMEYHSDRFTDFSLLVFKGTKLVATLPANRKEATVYSHQGLTYGGLLIESSIGFNYITAILQAIKTFLQDNGVTSLVIKQLPVIYEKRATNELLYLLNKQATVIDVQMVLAVDYSKPLQIHKTKLKYYRKGSGKGFVIKKETDFSSFWNLVLTPRLQEKHNAKPVHTLAEITALQQQFPEQIYQYNIYLDDCLLAGITVFETEQVVKSQYGATTALGEEHNAFDYLFLHLIYAYKDSKKYFSQGTVTEKNELGYNPGLLKQKEELGCEVFLQNVYSLQL